MRTLRVLLAGTVILMVLGSLSAAVMAQEKSDEDVAVTYVTGTVTDSVWDDSQLKWTSPYSGEGMRITETYEWSDPRLPAVKRSVMNFNEFPGGSGPAFLGMTTSRLEDSVGAWTGGARTMQYVDGRGVGWDVYVGEGAYEGLIAVLQCTSDSCEGQIFGGELPPVPDPVEPSAE